MPGALEQLEKEFVSKLQLDSETESMMRGLGRRKGGAFGRVAAAGKGGHVPGFSSVEILVLTAIATSFLAFSLPMINSAFSTYRLTRAADGVAGELQAARLLAVTRNDQTRLEFLDNSEPPQATTSAASARRIKITDTSTPAVQLRPDYILPEEVTFEKLPSVPIGFGSRGEIIIPAGGFTEDMSSILLRNGSGYMEIRIASNGRIRVIDKRTG